ncbi:TonB-dependent receptor [Mucilaginibacter sp. RS28]|uniref:TonB-dependent receptor n=1 Tax=Mucilaginibacter straminoryzae TaxID=2932774 RepID=A0A9X2B7K0_9SPHI|nr:TonB-dependent receptor [Mucilaginibacter straminoryzae]MCJ8208634.1 TonB-dependent receptor [Mucilaginibacter straminoryzae]
MMLPLFIYLFAAPSARAQSRVTGTIVDTTGDVLIGVAVRVKGTQIGSTTDVKGNFTITVPNSNAVLTVSYVGYITQEVPVNGQTTLRIRMHSANSALQEVVVTGYGTQKKQSITGSIASVTSKDIERVHGGSTVSTTLAGKIPGVTFRMPEGRPGAAASVQIRNMGPALFVVDGVQMDEGQFNNIAPNDIESISVLKDASAAIYGVRAANGVIVVTTKKGSGESRINVDGNLGFQNWFRFPNVLTNSYDYMRYLAEAQINSNGSTNITQADLDKYRAGTDPGYQSFNWRDYVMNSNKNAPLNQINVNFTGGSDKVNYYVSATNLYQTSQIGKEYMFGRSNIQSNISAKVASGLRVSANINGRIESRENPGVPGTDDYWLARFAVLRNTPLERPYANDNPNYLNDIGHNETNYAFLNEKLSGKYRSDWRVLQTTFNADYTIPGIKGLTARALYSYYIADEVLNNQEYTYNAYTYRPATNTYDITGGSTNPWREREQRKEFNKTFQAQLNYNNTFGKHTVGASIVSERIELQHQRNWVHATPISNSLPLIYFPTVDTYDDSDTKEARIGYIARINYNYNNKYYLEFSGRRDASYLFAPDRRVGYFPGASAGWRITQEDFMKKLLGDHSILNDLKFRGSYGILGDDRNPYDPNQSIVAAYSYLPGYNYNQGTVILDGNAITSSRDKGIIVNRISWLKSRMMNIGADFTMFNNKLTGTAEYFYRKRTGLPAAKNDVIIPLELGYDLPQENLNSDAQYGGEFALNWASKVGDFSYNIGGNVSYSRLKTLSFYNPTFFNSWDRYRNSGVNRLANINWGYEVIGQFTSQEQINNYKVNIDGKGNRTLLPGDLIYKDQNGDNKIDQYDERPNGYAFGKQPNINFGFTLGAAYKGFDFHADFSGGAGYSYNQNWEMRWPFQNGGNLNTIFEDSWRRANPYDVNSTWIPGKYPARRNNPGNGFSSYGNNSTFWVHNAKYLRARTIELGYSLSNHVLSKVKIKRARVYANVYNLFSLDNLKEYGLDPEIWDDNGLQFPQSRVYNVGINLTF